MYWEIIPSDDNDCDYIAMPGDTDIQHRNALKRAKDILEIEWDACKPGDTVTVSMKLCEGERPEE
jgi:hypothetical protein